MSEHIKLINRIEELESTIQSLKIERVDDFARSLNDFMLLIGRFPSIALILAERFPNLLGRFMKAMDKADGEPDEVSDDKEWKERALALMKDQYDAHCDSMDNDFNECNSIPCDWCVGYLRLLKEFHGDKDE